MEKVILNNGNEFSACSRCLCSLLISIEEYSRKVVHNTSEACILIENGSKYQTGMSDDGGEIFAKPKDPLAL
jgi:hypothetical protein